MTTRTLRTMTVLVLAALILAVPALAATKHGITPLSPKAGSTVFRGKSPTFTMKVRGKGSVWVYVCKSRKRDSKGLICSNESIGKARKASGGRYKFKPKFFNYPEFWLNSPGTYYWQAHRIQCEGNTVDCSQEGPVVKFKVG